VDLIVRKNKEVEEDVLIVREHVIVMYAIANKVLHGESVMIIEMMMMVIIITKNNVDKAA
jgi:hypothetical protein